MKKMKKKAKDLKKGDVIKHGQDVVEHVYLQALKLPSNKCEIHMKSGKVHIWCKNTLIALLGEV